MTDRQYPDREHCTLISTTTADACQEYVRTYRAVEIREGTRTLAPTLDHITLNRMAQGREIRRFSLSSDERDKALADDATFYMDDGGDLDVA
jgi:hypothetical protein